MQSLYISLVAVIYAQAKALSRRDERGGGSGSIETLLIIGFGIAAAVAVGAFVVRYISSNMPG